MRRALAILLSLSLSADAATYYVAPAYGTDTNTGLSWETAKSNLQALVNASGAGHTYNIGAGVHQMTNLALVLSANTALIGTNRDEVVLVAAPTNRVVYANGSNIFISSLGITGGELLAGSGAGILGNSELNSVIVSNCLVYSNFTRRFNSADRGAGIRYGIVSDSEIFGNVANYYGGGAAHSVVSNCAVYNNAVTGNAYGGGVDVCTVYNSRIYSNTAARGGGAYASTLFNSDIVGNYAHTYQGGGTYNCTVRGCSVVSNVSSHNGGGLAGGSVYDSVIAYNRTPLTLLMAGGGVDGAAVASNCVIAYNQAWGGGGANGSSLYGCHVVSNYASNKGGGTSVGSAHSSIIEGNTSAGTFDAMFGAAGTFNCTIAGHTNARIPVHGYSAEQFFANNILWGNASNAVATFTNLVNNWTNDPAFIPGTYKIAATSPCVDAGDNTYAATPYDFYGRDRVVDGGTGTATVDIGAAEYQSGIDDPVSSSRKKLFLPLLFE